MKKHIVFLSSVILMVLVFNSCKKPEVTNPQEYKSQLKFSNYEVSSEADNNGVPNPGEELEIKVFIENIGDYNLKNLKGKLTGSDKILSVNEGYSNFYSGVSNYQNPNIYKQTKSYAVFKLKVDPNAKPGNGYKLALEMLDNYNNVYVDSLTIFVHRSGDLMKLTSYTFYSEMNSDKKINSGEKIEMYMDFLNMGSSTWNTVKVECSSNSPNVFNINSYDALDYYNPKQSNNSSKIGPNEIATPYYYETLDFTVRPNTPAGTVLPFFLEISDKEGKKTLDTVYFTVEKYDIDVKFNSFEIYTDGNYDKKINPGESVTLKVKVFNDGANDAFQIKGYYTCTDSRLQNVYPYSYVSFNNSGYNYTYSSTYDKIYAKGFGYSEYYYYLSFKVATSTPRGTKIKINLNLKDGMDNTWVQEIEIPIE